MRLRIGLLQTHLMSSSWVIECRKPPTLLVRDMSVNDALLEITPSFCLAAVSSGGDLG